MPNSKAAFAALTLLAALCLGAQLTTAAPTTAPTSMMMPTTAPTSMMMPTGAPTTMAPTKMAPTTMAPTKMAPTTMAPTPSPTKAPSTPTMKPTMPTMAPTPLPTRHAGSCMSGYYMFQGICNKCLSRKSPFVTKRGGYTCYPPATLSSKSVACTPLTLPIAIRAISNTKKTKTCIGMKDSRLTTIFLPITSSKYDYVSRMAYKKVSLRLNNTIPPKKNPRNGQVITELVKVKGVTHLQVQFEDTFGTFHRLASGAKVKLTGVLERGGSLLPVCFVAYTKIC